MDPELEAVKTAALAAGWTVKSVINESGTTVYQLHNPAGDYVVSNTSDVNLWKRAVKRGHLPAA